MLEELERTTDGAHILAGHALLNTEFKQLMINNFIHMIQEIDKVKGIEDAEKMWELLPVIYEER